MNFFSGLNATVSRFLSHFQPKPHSRNVPDPLLSIAAKPEPLSLAQLPIATDRKPRLCLIGTSNGVPEEGYSQAFKDSQDLSHFEKHCLGFSSSALFSLMSKRIDFAKFDICILDFAVNDGAQLMGGKASPTVVHATVSDAVRTILAAGCLPALFILPIRPLLKAQSNLVVDLYLSIAQEFSLPVFDGYRYLDHLALPKDSLQTLFHDDLHLNRRMARQLATAFLNGLVIAHKMRGRKGTLFGRAPRFTYIDIGQTTATGASLTQRGTRLFSADIIDIGDQTDCVIEGLPQKAELTALAIDFANSRGSLAISSKDETLTHTSHLVVTNPYFGDDPKRFIYGFTPLRHPLPVTDGSISVSMAGNRQGAGRLGLGGVVVSIEQDYTIALQLGSSLFVSSAYPRFGLVQKLRDTSRWRPGGFAFEGLNRFLERAATQSGLYSIKILGVFFDLYVRNRGVGTTVILFHDAIQDRSQASLPHFEQLALPDDVNVVLVSDPSLYIDETLCQTWFAGHDGCPTQDILTIILKSLAQALGASRVIVGGAGSGGFAALYFAHRLETALCLSFNPDVDIAKSQPASVLSYAQSCFRASHADAVEAVLRTKMTSRLVDLYEANVPNYVVNLVDEEHESHEIDLFAAAAGKTGAGRIITHRHASHGQWVAMIAEAAQWPGDWDAFVLRPLPVKDGRVADLAS